MVSQAQIEDALNKGGRIVGKILLDERNRPVTNRDGKAAKGLTAHQLSRLHKTGNITIRESYDGQHTINR